MHGALWQKTKKDAGLKIETACRAVHSEAEPTGWGVRGACILTGALSGMEGAFFRLPAAVCPGCRKQWYCVRPNGRHRRQECRSEA